MTIKSYIVCALRMCLLIIFASTYIHCVGQKTRHILMHTMADQKMTRLLWTFVAEFLRQTSRAVESFVVDFGGQFLHDRVPPVFPGEASRNLHEVWRNIPTHAILCRFQLILRIHQFFRAGAHSDNLYAKSLTRRF